MNPRLAKPLIAALVGSALLAGGAVLASPAYADDPTTNPGVTEPATGESTEPSTGESTEPSTGESTEPSTGESTEPSTGESTEPSTGESTEPSTGESTPPVEPPAPDTVKPSGTFALSTTSAWIKQAVTFTQNETNYSDNQDANSVLTRLVTFGDGTSVKLAPGQTTFNKKYSKVGSYKVIETITDTSGNAFVTPAKTVTVTAPAKVTFNTHTVYQVQGFKITFAGVPNGTSKIAVNWGDGYEDTFVGKNQTIGGYYYRDADGKIVLGKRTITVKYTNKNGTTDPIAVGTVTVLQDKSKPVVKITKPSSANRIKSWSTVRGTATDTGSGIQKYAYVYVTRVTGNKVYCFTAKKKWIRVYTEEQFDNNCTAVQVTIVKGKWGFKLPGLGTGDLYVDAIAGDRVGHVTIKSLHVKVTKK